MCRLAAVKWKMRSSMEEKNTVACKSKRFAIRIVRMYRYLCEQKHEYIMSKQVLRSGTSIGANIAEAECSISRNEFLAKMYIAFKECAETEYWLELLYETDYLDAGMYQDIRDDCMELRRMLSAITRTIRND